MSDKTKWSPQIALQPSQETTEESKHIRQVQALSTASPQRDEFDELLESYRLRKVLRIGAWIQRFIRNSRSPSADREYGPLKTNETEHQTIWWIQRVQQEADKRGEIGGVKVLLNLQLNDTGVLECRGRIAGQYPIFLPENSDFMRKVVEQAHLTTLHGGVASTMARVRERYWVPKLRRMVKKARSDCFGCVKFRSQAHHLEIYHLREQKAQRLPKSWGKLCMSNSLPIKTESSKESISGAIQSTSKFYNLWKSKNSYLASKDQSRDVVAQKLSTQTTPRLLKQPTNGSTKFEQTRSSTRFLQVVQSIGNLI